MNRKGVAFFSLMGMIYVSTLGLSAFIWGTKKLLPKEAKDQIRQYECAEAESKARSLCKDYDSQDRSSLMEAQDKAFKKLEQLENEMREDTRNLDFDPSDKYPVDDEVHEMFQGKLTYREHMAIERERIVLKCMESVTCWGSRADEECQQVYEDCQSTP